MMSISNSDFRISFFGVMHFGVAKSKTESIRKEIDFNVDLVCIERSDQETTIYEKIMAFLRNPTVSLFLYVYTLFGILWRCVMWIFRGKYAAADDIAASKIAQEHDAEIMDVDKPISRVINNQGLSWVAPSWIFFIAILSSTYAQYESILNLVSTIIIPSLMFAGLYSYSFLATTIPERNLYMMSNIVEAAEDNEKICVITGKNHIDNFEENCNAFEIPFSSHIINRKGEWIPKIGGGE